MKNKKVFLYVFFVLLTSFSVFSVAKIDLITSSGSGNSTSLWTASGNNIYYNTGNVSIGTSSNFPYILNVYGKNSGLYLNMSIDNTTTASGTQIFNTALFQTINKPTFATNTSWTSQGATFYTETGGTSAIDASRNTTTIGAVFVANYSVTTALGTTNYAIGVIGRASGDSGIGQKYNVGGLFQASGSNVIPTRDYAVYAKGDSVIGNDGDQSYIRTAPQECVGYNANTIMRSTSMSFLGEGGMSTTPFDAMCIIHIPYGYEIYEFIVYGTANRNVTMYESAVSNAGATARSVGCTAGVPCVLNQAIPYGTATYAIIFIDFTGTGDRTQGILTSIRRRFDTQVNPTYKVTP